ncbi:MAG: sulfurtransferase/chromate resistance protein [Beijerinckiaceae bacterium]|jgi:rhodanese-related sulfurtransferase|nr:sulfurtransferase/chromate resistance protein [Beijerinckiaceae bacterium]
MSSNISISAAQLSKLAGLPDAPVIIDVRIPDDVAADPRRLPGSDSRSHTDVSVWANAYAGQRVVVSCQRGLKLSEGVAAWLRHHGVAAENLAGGFEAWRDAGGLLLRSAALPPRDAAGRSVWVTRTRPKVDRIACPWLIRRFVDRHAVFLFVSPLEVAAVAERFAATPFDIEGVFWSHRGERCSFDVMVEEFGLATPALDRLAAIVRAADTATLETVPEAAGFLAASLGLSRMFRDDLAQLDAGMLLCDAMYRWCRDASEETHNWPAAAGAAKGPTS